jgi:hypothetical protein
LQSSCWQHCNKPQPSAASNRVIDRSNNLTILAHHTTPLKSTIRLSSFNQGEQCFWLHLQQLGVTVITAAVLLNLEAAAAAAAVIGSKPGCCGFRKLILGCNKAA